MQTHTSLGGEILSDPDSPLLVMARDIAMSHHEQWDGCGYPEGLAGENISLEGRITSVCDVFDALTSSRPYKKAWTVDEACDFLKEKRGTMFDPSLVDLFIKNRHKAERILEEFKDQD
jgi:putative two-component system response regulator